MNNKTILEHYGLRTVEVAGTHVKTDITPVVNPDLVVGVELEIENFPLEIDGPLYNLSIAEDGSLRNRGRELITYPIATKHLEHLLKQVVKGCRLGARNYSDRCSTHVHANVQNLTLQQLKAIALIYQVSERLLFQFVGNERENNIFCVPWYQADVTRHMMSAIDGNALSVSRNWYKYTALNFQPVGQKGTIEFRHLHGTCDVPLILTWVNLIGSIFKYATSNTYERVADEILALNTVSNYDGFAHQVFGGLTDVLFTHNYRELLTLGVVDAKLLLLNPPKAAKKSRASLDSDFEAYIARIRADDRARGTQAIQGDITVTTTTTGPMNFAAWNTAVDVRPPIPEAWENLVRSGRFPTARIAELVALGWPDGTRWLDVAPPAEGAVFWTWFEEQRNNAIISQARRRARQQRIQNIYTTPPPPMADEPVPVIQNDVDYL